MVAERVKAIVVYKRCKDNSSRTFKACYSIMYRARNGKAAERVKTIGHCKRKILESFKSVKNLYLSRFFACLNQKKNISSAYQ
jgi:hypothetical protein